MLKWFKQLDDILRGQATRLEALKLGKIEIPISGLTVALLLLGLTYGLCMGSFALIRTSGQAYMQAVASTIKLPMLFFLTLIVTFPSLYVFNALVGSRLSIVSVLRLLIATLGVMLAVLASLGPIVVFFALSTTSYSFMVLLNVAACSVSGILGLAFLLRTMHRLVMVHEGKEPKPYKQSSDLLPVNDNQLNPPAAPVAKDTTSALDRVGDYTSKKAKAVFKIWVMVFALVGAQMSWVLRPLIGDPNLAFQWFRAREGNFFIAVIKSLISLLS